MVFAFIIVSLLIFPKADHSHLRKIDWWRKENRPAIDKLRDEISADLQVFTTTKGGGGVGILNPLSDEEAAIKLKLELEKLSPPAPVIIIKQ